MPIFSSMEPHDTLLRTPGAPLASGMNFRHDEQRNPLHALGRALDAGQHQMDDVLRQVVLAGGNEDLLAGNLVAAILVGHCLGAQQIPDRCRSAAR